MTEIEKWAQRENWKYEGRLKQMATVGRFQAIEEEEDNGIYLDDEGVLTASVVGAAEFHNERVWFGLTIDGQDSAMDVRDLNILESID